MLRKCHKNIYGIMFVIIFYFMFCNFTAFAAPQENSRKTPTLNKELKSDVVWRVGRILETRYIFPETAKKCRIL